MESATVGASTGAQLLGGRTRRWATDSTPPVCSSMATSARDGARSHRMQQRLFEAGSLCAGAGDHGTTAIRQGHTSHARIACIEGIMESSTRGAQLLAWQRYEVRDALEHGATAVMRVTWTAQIAGSVGPFRAGQPLKAHLAQFITCRDGRVARLETTTATSHCAHSCSACGSARVLCV